MGRALALATLALSLSLPALAEDAVPKSEDDKILYTLGAFAANRLGFNMLALTEQELKMVMSGLEDTALDRKAKVPFEEYAPKLQEFRTARLDRIYEVEVKDSAAFLEQEAKRDGVVRTSSGLIYEELSAGSGDKPTQESKVRVHYHGTLRDGRTFDSSLERGQPNEFGLDGVIGCWTEGLQLMQVGGRARLVCPASIAYGKRGAGGMIKPGAALVFEVELLEIVE